MAVIPAPDATMEWVAKLERWGPFRLRRDGQGNVCAELTISVVGGLSDAQLVGFLTHTRHAIQGIYEDFHASTSTEPVPDTPAHMPVADAYVTELITAHRAQEFGVEMFVAPSCYQAKWVRDEGVFLVVSCAHMNYKDYVPRAQLGERIGSFNDRQSLVRVMLTPEPYMDACEEIQARMWFYVGAGASDTQLLHWLEHGVSVLAEALDTVWRGACRETE